MLVKSGEASVGGDECDADDKYYKRFLVSVVKEILRINFLYKVLTHSQARSVYTNDFAVICDSQSNISMSFKP